MSRLGSVLIEAQDLINGSRQEQYGPPTENFTNIAVGWSVLLKTPVSASQVAACMLWLKLARESYKPGHDNRVDMAGYVGLLDELVAAELLRFEQDLAEMVGEGRNGRKKRRKRQVRKARL